MPDSKTIDSLMHRLTISVLALVFLLPAGGHSSLAKAPLWQLEDRFGAAYQAAMTEGDALAKLAVRAVGNTNRRRVGVHRARQVGKDLAKKALERYESAAKLFPEREEPNYRAGEVLSAFFLEEETPAPSMLDRGIEHWRQFEKKAPLDPRMRHIVDRRSIALTKRGGTKNLSAAIADYAALLLFMDPSNDYQRSARSRLLSNRAEVQMMLGYLDKAIVGYEQALKLEPNAVYGYGLAVALDRDKQGARARDVARLHAQGDSRNALSHEFTFFVPAGERYYYEGLRYEGLGKTRSAIQAYKNFLKFVPRSQWSQQARANIADLEKSARSRRTRKAR